MITTLGEGIDTNVLPEDRDDNINIKQMPWMVSIGYYSSDRSWHHHCSGSLIEENYILSAASCFDKFLPNLKLRLGSTDLILTSEGQYILNKIQCFSS